jgi:hypothetical protein
MPARQVTPGLDEIEESEPRIGVRKKAVAIE